MTSAARKLAVSRDPTIYPVEDGVGEGSLQRLISELLRPLLERFLAERGTPAFVGADQYFYWEQYNPSECIAPDVYVLPGVPASTEVKAWKVWETRRVPSFALEVVSGDVDKDYLVAPAKYARLGVEELVVFMAPSPLWGSVAIDSTPSPRPSQASDLARRFDPESRSSASRVRFQVFRRTQRGLVRALATDADRVKSKVLGCTLRAVGAGGGTRIRIATGRGGETLFPTDAEARSDLESQLDAERRHRQELEAELAKLRAAREKPRR